MYKPSRTHFSPLLSVYCNRKTNIKYWFSTAMSILKMPFYRFHKKNRIGKWKSIGMIFYFSKRVIYLFSSLPHELEMQHGRTTRSRTAHTVDILKPFCPYVNNVISTLLWCCLFWCTSGSDFKCLSLLKMILKFNHSYESYTEKNSPVVLFIMLYKVALTFS